MERELTLQEMRELINEVYRKIVDGEISIPLMGYEEED